MPEFENLAQSLTDYCIQTYTHLKFFVFNKPSPFGLILSTYVVII